MDKPGTLRHLAVIEYVGAPIAWFYFQLGFDTLVAREVPDADYIRTLSDGGLSGISICKFANGDGALLEVISVPHRPPSTPAPWNHIAVSVDDCSARVNSLVAGGGTLVGGPVRSTSGPYVVAYVRDPSGNLVELVQRLPKFE